MQTHPFNSRQPLGYKTFWLFLLKNSLLALVFFVIMIFFLIISSIGAGTLTSGMNMTDEGAEAIQAFFILGLLSSAFIFILLAIVAGVYTWFEYKNYTFVIDEHALEVSRGVFHKENISIPYQHIENINLEQTLIWQILGVCRIVIKTAAEQHSHPDSEDESEGVLPVIDLKTGQEIQTAILARSHVQEVMHVERKEDGSLNSEA